jgi:hypothetical protein
MRIFAYTGSDSKRYALALLVLTVLFAFRVIAQLLQFWHPIDILPPFEAWHSGTLPYRWLVGAQVLILTMCLRIVWQLFTSTVRPSPRKGHLLLVLGCVYFGGMCIRLVVGLTIAPDHDWFGAIMPTVFHLVLASFVVLYGRFHSMASRELVEMQKVAPA